MTVCVITHLREKPNLIILPEDVPRSKSLTDVFAEDWLARKKVMIVVDYSIRKFIGTVLLFSPDVIINFFVNFFRNDYTL